MVKRTEEIVHKIMGKKCDKNAHERRETVIGEKLEHQFGKEKRERYK